MGYLTDLDYGQQTKLDIQQNQKIHLVLPSSTGITGLRYHTNMGSGDEFRVLCLQHKPPTDWILSSALDSTVSIGGTPSAV